MASPEIDTARLRLRPLTPRDLDALHCLLTQPGVRRYLLDDEVIPRERAQSFIGSSVASFDANGYGLWGATAKGSDALIGFCGFWLFHEPPRLELLYGLGDDCRRKGFATEMAVSMIRYGFETLGFVRIEASTDASNAASVAVMERAGMTFWKRNVTNELETIYYAIEPWWPGPAPLCGILAGNI
jgi:ribosomal-protein-alanine N-acetyltransferase